MLARILVVAPVRPTLARVRQALTGPDALIWTAQSEAALWERLSSQNFDLVFLAGPTPETASLIADIRDLPDRPEVVILAERDDPEGHAAAVAAGCLGVVDLRVTDATLRRTVSALVGRRLDDAVAPPGIGAPPEAGPAIPGFGSASPTMQAFLSTARRVAHADSTVLLLGETGVGKEWLARSIHGESSRSLGPFVAINCAALAESLLESEFFGHVKGAYTGADHARRGAFELAHGGTIFLDEIAELPPHLQAKLLRVLESRRIHPVGSERPIDVDIRVMAATNRDLEEEIRAKRFRPDLYYRLNVVSLTVPPLRDRREDVPALVRLYFEEYRGRLGSDVRRIHPAVLRCMQEYEWPGNVRELINTVERAILLCSASEITLDDLPLPVRGPVSSPAAPRGSHSETEVVDVSAVLDRPWPEARRAAMASVERAYFSRLLARTRGSVGAAAALAGIDPRSLYEKTRRHGIRKERFRTRNGR